jgi:tRNA threonylcarbamoyladenosine biosynthesis protein TsaE
MSVSIERHLPGPEATTKFGKQFAAHLKQGCVVYLHGELGAGKTTLVRSVLQGLDYQERVKSPTYTLVERHDLADLTVFHFDLYRLTDPEELEFLGIRDYLDGNSLVFIEWPERGEGFLPAADIDIKLAYDNDARRIECVGLTDKGQESLEALAGENAKI